MKADEGNSIVIMDKNDYISRMEKVIEEGGYLRVEKNPVITMVRDNKVIKEIKTLFGEKIKWRLMVPNTTTSIKFTVEIEKMGKLPFLDLELTRAGERIDIAVYRKITQTERYITSDSYCPIQHKLAAFQSMAYRLCKLPLSITNFKREYDHLKYIAKINGYKESTIDKIIKKHSRKIKNSTLTTLFTQNQREKISRVKMNFAPAMTNRLKQVFRSNKMQLVLSNQNKLKTLLGTTKDKTPDIEKSGIYEISCGECNKKYYGQSKRAIQDRFKEHMRSVRLNQPKKSSFGEHVLENDHLNIPTNALKLLKHTPDEAQLDAYESFFIYKNREISVNADNGNIDSYLFEIFDNF